MCAGSYVIDEAMIADLKAEGLTEESLKKIEPLKGKRFDPEGVWAVLRPILHADEVVSKKLKEIDERIRATGRPAPEPVVDGAIEGYSAQGYRGQFLVVLPAAPNRRRPPASRPKADSIKTDDFGEFTRMVQDLVPSASDSPKGGDGR